MNTRRNLLTGLGAAALGWTAWQGSKTQALPNALAGSPARSGGIPNVTLHTHDGRSVKAYDDLIKGKIVAINMMYTDCQGICPGATMNLKQVQTMLGERVGRDVFMYSISLRPEEDTPQRLREYADAHHIGPGWLLLTGARRDIEALRFALGFFEVDPERDADRLQHTGMVRIGNERYQRWAMTPALAGPDEILSTINHVDPKVVHTAARAMDTVHAMTT